VNDLQPRLARIRIHPIKSLDPIEVAEARIGPSGGLERDRAGMEKALATIVAVERAANGEPSLLNMAASAKLVAVSALARHESRGGHFRSDYPKTDEKAARTFMTLNDANAIAAGVGPTIELASAAR